MEGFSTSTCVTFFKSSDPLSWPKSSRRLSYKISNSIDLVAIAYVICGMASLRLVSPKENWEKIQARGRNTLNTMDFLNPHFLQPLLRSRQKGTCSFYIFMNAFKYFYYLCVYLYESRCFRYDGIHEGSKYNFFCST